MADSTRRDFLKQSTAAAVTAAGVIFVHPSRVRGTEANSAISLGLIGCGGRGTWIADLFAKHGNYRLAAGADYFAERAAAFGDRFGLAAEQRFSGLSGYRQLLDQPLDAVVIETPPYFHPQQAEEAVGAGKHVFLSKPIAVDVPGCLTVRAAGEQATSQQLVFLVDFQTRTDSAFQETIRRVREGAIGKLISGEAHYPWSGNVHDQPLQTPDDRLRYWYQTLALSGDVIVEQDIHTLDVATWFTDSDPLWAVGSGGRAVRQHGEIWDHFSVIYQFPNDFLLTFTSQKAVPGIRDEIRCRVFGTAGVADTDYMGDVWIRGQNPYEGATMDNLYTRGAVANIAEFHRCITAGDCQNSTVAPSVRSNLTCVLGRTAAYQGGKVTWQEMLDQSARLELDRSGLRT